MPKLYVIYNPLANNGRSIDVIKKYAESLKEEYVLCNMTEGYSNVIDEMQEDDSLIICGGDGTLNRFVNEVGVESIKGDVLYLACGSGNDFAHDISLERDATPVSIKKYLYNLPEAEINGQTYKFINAIGFGIDGYCCEEGDRQRAIPGKKVDYTAIAIKGMLGKFSPRGAKITIDGETKEYKKVWLAPAMHGRYYGGGMIAAPEQNRETSETLSLMIWRGAGRIRTLIAFPSIFKGEHVKHKNQVQILRGKEIKVEFDKPCALQVDGETILNVSSYTAKVKVPAKV